MNQQQSKKEEDNGGLGELHQKEINLIQIIREEFRYGVIEVQTSDGLPQMIVKTIKRKKL